MAFLARKILNVACHIGVEIPKFPHCALIDTKTLSAKVLGSLIPLPISSPSPARISERLPDA
jgi:hypothetical protein